MNVARVVGVLLAVPAVVLTIQTVGVSNSKYAGEDFSLALATPLLAVVLCGLALVAAQVPHLDRMVAATGRSFETWDR